MPMWPYENFDACVIDQKSKWHSDESANKICGEIKDRIENAEELSQKFSEQTKVSAALAKRIIDNLNTRGMDIRMFDRVLWKLQNEIAEVAVQEKLNKSSDEEIGAIIDEITMDSCFAEITLSEGEFDENKEYELITTAKQTDSRYGDFEYTKSDLETMASNFNEDIVGTEIPVDLNHDPDHIAYAWIKPGSMVVRESTKLKGQYSLYGQLHRFTPKGQELVTTGAVRYFSLQIQHTFTKFVDKAKKVYRLVIRAMALTNMPVIKDMAPTLSEEKPLLFPNHSLEMETKELEQKLAEKDTILADKDKELSELRETNKKLADDAAARQLAEHEKFLGDEVEKLCLSEDKNIGFKGGEKESILAFVKTLSEDQAKAYFELHTNILTGVKLGEEGDGWEPADAPAADGAEAEVATKAQELSKKEKISYREAMERVLSENPDLAKKLAD